MMVFPPIPPIFFLFSPGNRRHRLRVLRCQSQKTQEIEK